MPQNVPESIGEIVSTQQNSKEESFKFLGASYEGPKVYFVDLPAGSRLADGGRSDEVGGRETETIQISIEYSVLRTPRAPILYPEE
ncbi:hypothetical protein N7528_003668 [Penicillium herquei]|nr:hypothetical protein N7528_003668 [Penicillium herquei]